ncbi:MAG: DUF4268 domain-containing protein [Candidatus Marinimicrobia bacterium]|nr:DUF4268 domain-containing protein [Candidatus Neomarinimicrobiota bacterium]
MTDELGRLERVDLRDIWKREAKHFTSWLAEEKNMTLLGDTIGLDLEFEAQEKDVGPYRADIVCRDTADGSWVLIENQLEKTDHTHLGQILTYAAGLKAVTIVWIAKRFTDEHQATLEWLNDVTGNNVNFFGLEIELWQIGNSPIAPKFNIAVKPNEWTKTATPREMDLTPAKKLQFEYWTVFKEYLVDNVKRIKPTKALPQHWMNFSLGRSYFGMYSFVDTRNPRIGVRLFLEGMDAKAHFHLLHKDCEEIEHEMGQDLVWDELPDKKSSYISAYNQNMNPHKRNNWTKQHEYLLATLEKMHEVFSDRIKKLDAGDYIPDNSDDLE